MTILDNYPDLLAAICVWREARGEPYPTKLAIARVIRNRAKRSGTPMDVVVLKPKQFTSFNPSDPNATKLPNRSNAAGWNAFIESCKAVEESVAVDPVGGATHYFDDSIPTPSWAKAMTQTAKLGRVTFFKEV
jgi:spore germination cell wall hydrolase CwlJ-like protein